MGVFEYVPEIQNCFCLWMTFIVGGVDSEGGDYFRLKVCTSEWLRRNVSDPLWGRHVLVVDEYRPQDIIDFVSKYISSLDERDWLELANKISRVMEWEFEDYA